MATQLVAARPRAEPVRTSVVWVVNGEVSMAQVRACDGVNVNPTWKAGKSQQRGAHAPRQTRAVDSRGEALHGGLTS